MKAKLIIDGREIEVEISEEHAKALTEKSKKKTGYERVKENEIYFSQAYDGKATDYNEVGDHFDDSIYASANYYSDKTVAENNARADGLYRQLRRFAVEHRETEIDWKEKEEEESQKKFVIYFVSFRMMLSVTTAFDQQAFGGIYFDSEETAQLAIDTFRNELMWYFTEYRDSL